MAIKALIFDNYGVLMSPVFDSLRSLLPLKLFQQIVEAGRLSDSGQISAAERARVAINVLNQAGYDGRGELNKAYGRASKNDRLFQFIKNSHDKYKTAMLSNASSNIRDLYKGTDLNQYFDQLILSYQVGVIKPDRRIYQLTDDRLGVRPDECVFADDNPTNVAAATACGMKGIVYTDFDTYIAELRKYTDA